MGVGGWIESGGEMTMQKKEAEPKRQTPVEKEGVQGVCRNKAGSHGYSEKNKGWREG